MDNSYICKRCKNNVKNCNRDTHELYCAYSVKQDELQDLIPCEICNNFVEFSNYQAHIDICGRYSYNYVNPITYYNTTNTNNPNNPNNDTDTTEDSETTNYITPTTTSNTLNNSINHPTITSENILNLLNNIIDRSTTQNIHVIDDVHNINTLSPNFSPPPIPPSPLSETINQSPTLTPSSSPTLSPNLSPLPIIDNDSPSPPTTPPPPTPSSSSFNFEDIINTSTGSYIRPITIRGSETFTNPIVTHPVDINEEVSNEIPLRTNSININNFITNTIDNAISNAVRVYYPNPAYNPPHHNTSYESLIELQNRIGIVEKGIENIDLVAPITKTNEEIKCPICTEYKTNIRKTLCGHSYCCFCIEKWLKKNKKCPICMKSLDEIDIPDEDIYADE